MASLSLKNGKNTADINEVKEEMKGLGFQINETGDKVKPWMKELKWKTEGDVIYVSSTAQKERTQMKGKKSWR